MFVENENPVIDEITENVEETTEETDGISIERPEAAETFTKEQVDEMIAKKLARKEAKIRKEYDKKYGRLESVLKAGTGVESVEEMTDTFADFYTKKGIQMPSTPQYSDRDMEYLAERDANEIIEGGYDEIREELNRLTDIGFDNMSKSDKHIFLKLKQEADRITNEKELKSIGITELPEGFNEFAKKFSSDVSLKEQYELYTQLNPKKKGETIGSMKTGQAERVKSEYSEEEISRMTLDDLDNDEVWEAVRRSMTSQR